MRQPSEPERRCSLLDGQCRTVLCFWKEEDSGGRIALRHAAGLHAVEASLDDLPTSVEILELRVQEGQLG